MKKKLVALLLMLAMTVSLMAGCKSGGATEEATVTDATTESTTTESTTTESTTETTAAPQEISDITVSFWSLSKVPEETSKVEEAINAITEKEIGVRVHLNIMDVGSYIPNGAMANGVANGEDFDLILTAPALSGHYITMSNNGMLLPLNDLLDQYGQELKATVPAQFLDATTKDGKIYGVPVYGNKVKNLYWICRKAIADGAGIDTTTIKTVADIEAALLKIQAKYPDMTPLGGASRTTNMTYPGYALSSGATYQKFDTLGESTAFATFVDYEDSSLTAVSRYESDAYKADIATIKKWFDLGLVDKDIATDTATSNPLAEKANVASVFIATQTSLAQTYLKTEPTVMVKLADGTVGTGALLQFTWALPVSCDEQEASMKFMNKMYTDERITNLIVYGVEGVHYVKKADGTVGFLSGMTGDTSGYYLGGISELVGNAYLTNAWEGGDPNKAANEKAEMDKAKYSPLTGFVLDTSKVADVYAQLTGIADQQYGPALLCGIAPDGHYEEFLSKLKAAGLQEYIDEANRQIKEWLANK